MAPTCFFGLNFGLAPKHEAMISKEENKEKEERRRAHACDGGLGRKELQIYRRDKVLIFLDL